MAGRRRVLLVDDEPALRRVVRRALAKAGFEVVEAPNGKVASDLAQQSAFDLVVTDVDMPVMGGLELLRWLATKQPELPVLVMSGSFDVSTADAAGLLGACRFLRKPFLMSDLRHCALRAVSDEGQSMRPELDWEVNRRAGSPPRLHRGKARTGTTFVMRKFTPWKTTSSIHRWASTTRRRWGRILVVDDYDDARATMREALEEVGHVVIEARNGQEALNFLVSRPDERVSLIIADLQMPVMDGWRLIELLKCYVKLSTLPVIVATSAREPHLERITHRAVRGCLRAPYDMKALVDMVDECLNPTQQGGSGSP